MGPLFEFGMSQEDVLTEMAALRLEDGDHLLCIASAGEIPLGIAARSGAKITAVDTSEAALSLTRLKLEAVARLGTSDAARLLGYRNCRPAKRLQIFREIEGYLLARDRAFFLRNSSAIERGVINLGRFEKYLSKLRPLVIATIGRRHLERLLGFRSEDEQREYFDAHFRTKILKRLFGLAFHPSIYRNRGVRAAALTHSGTTDIAAFFFSRFRDFCTATLARENYFYQFTFFGEVLCDDALPELFSGLGQRALETNRSNVELELVDFRSALVRAKKGRYNKFHLSNIGDWMSKEAFADLLQVICRQASPVSRAVARYIHLEHEIPSALEGVLQVERELGLELLRRDRYPFYNVVPISIVVPDGRRIEA